MGMKAWIGRTMNTLGVPAMIHDCDYESEELGTKIKVKRGDRFTLLTVNGVDVYFDRITGKIDGVGFNPTADCTADRTPISTAFRELPEMPVAPAQMRRARV